MTSPNVILNSGDFFVKDAVEHLASSTLLSDAEIEEMLSHTIEHFEHHHAHLNDNATAAQVGFFFLNRALHILGYTHSHHEPLGEDHRIEYTLFDSPHAFSSHVAARGTHSFFNGAVGIGKLAAWVSDLNDAPEVEGAGAPESLAFELESQMRLTNLPWAILSNGRLWRLYHKNTAAMVNSYFEVNLLEILEKKDLAAYKIFASAFCAKAISPDKSGSCENKRLLA